METANIIPIYIEEEMRSSYLDYAMSVIISRALPDVRDGLKPVHRRILYAMLKEGLTAGKKFSKCAGVVGEVLKKYHPHGDSAVYGSLVRMAQPWNLRYPLIDGQGNFGSVDGDPPAAYRYTECRMKHVSEYLLSDIEKNTVDFSPNFDDTTEEPDVLPSRIPNLLINGGEGIAVGMASSIPPHNLREVIEGTIKLIENPDLTLVELMECIPAPDFPTGGVIYGVSPVVQVYKTGRGILKIRSRVHTEVIKGSRGDNEALVIDEIPYQVNKAKLIEKIAELVNDKKIEGIARLRDESDRHGMRIVIETKRGVLPEIVLNQLYKMTQLEESYGVTMRAIVDGSPKILNLQEILQCFIEHRRVVVTRRTKFELEKARARLHILEGLRIALTNIEEVIAMIRAADSTAEAKEQLIARFALSDIQAQHILDMPLKRLTGLERQAIEDEYNELLALIDSLLKLLADSKEIDKVIVQELTEIKDNFGDERRTGIEQFAEELEIEDLIAEEDMVVTVSHRGYLKRCSPNLFRAQSRGGRGAGGIKNLTEDYEDFIQEIFVASTHANLFVFTNKGRLFSFKVYKIPETSRTARGRAIVNMVGIENDERVTALLPVRQFEENKKVVMVTKKGIIKRVNLMDFSNVRSNGLKATVLLEGDELISTLITNGEEDIMLSTAKGMTIRFRQDKVRVMSRQARGVKGIRMKPGDYVVGAVVVSPPTEEERAEEERRLLEEGVAQEFSDITDDSTESQEEDELAEDVEESNEDNEIAEEEETSEEGGDELDEEPLDAESLEAKPVGRRLALLSVSENGYGKRTLMSRYRVTGRGCQGCKDFKTQGRNGLVIGSCEVEETHQVMLTTTTGRIIRMPVSDIRVIRHGQGVRLIKLDEGEKVASIAKIVDDSSGQDETTEEEK